MRMTTGVERRRVETMMGDMGMMRYTVIVFLSYLFLLV
jgi:hypothetical protein